MERPFVVCHMLASLDGKIDGAFFGAQQTDPALQVYGELRGFYGCQATLYGTTTMLGGYADGKVSPLSANEEEPLQEDWVNPAGKEMGNFIIAVDPAGELAYSGPTLEKKGRPAAHVVEALTQQASPAYLAYLQERGVSYLFAGKERLDCTLLLQKLRNLFGIEKLMVAGGGIVNWSFLAAGLIDELSLVIAPVADGGTESVSIFEQSAFLPCSGPVAFHLVETKVMNGAVLWLRYNR